MTQTWVYQARRRAEKAACASSAEGGGPASKDHRRFRGRRRFVVLRWRLFCLSAR